MLELKNKQELPLARFIAPAFPEVNIFSRHAKKITSLGLIMVATAANKLLEWRVEVIDENNYLGPRAKTGLPNHDALQKENPAQVVGFYCGLTSTMERVFELAEYYKRQNVATIAGGWHAHYCAKEALDHKIDIVVHGDGEFVIRQILVVLEKGGPLADIPGISFWEQGEQKTNPPEILEIPCLEKLPYPDFGLLRRARKIKYYPIGRIRGCGMNCEFCSVKGRPRWARARHLFNVVNWLVETRGAKSFFIVDDRVEEDLLGSLEFFRMIAQKYGGRLRFIVQIRLDSAKNAEFLEAMKKAGVRTVCIGYESPIDEDLKTMRKGYLSSQMVEWTKILRSYFWVHGMFIFGYPARQKTNSLSVAEMVKRFKQFIRRAKIDSIQVLHPVPLVGTGLRSRLEKEGRLSPQELVPWNRYDGNYACFLPNNMTLAELQETPLKITKWFYSPLSFWKIPLRTIAFPVDLLVRGWHRWHRGWLKDIVNFGGHLLIKKWLNHNEQHSFLKKLEEFASKSRDANSSP